MTGQPPFNGNTVIDLIVNVCTQELAYPATIPRDCQQLLDLMLAKDPDRRLSDGEALVKAMEDLAKGKTPKLDDTGSREFAAVAPDRTPIPGRRRRRFRYRR